MEFVCRAKGKPTPKVTWLKADEYADEDHLMEVELSEQPQETDSRLIITQAHPRHENPKYKVLVENSAGKLEKEFGVIGKMKSSICYKSCF